MTDKKKSSSKPATTATDFFAVAAAGATGTTAKSKTEKRKVTIDNDPQFTNILKNLTVMGELEDQAKAEFSTDRGILLNEYAIEAFLKGPNADSFQMTDGKGGMVMVAPTDRGLKIGDDERLEYLISEYGEDIACKSFEFSFNPEVIDHPKYGPIVKAAISQALQSADIPAEMKATVFEAKPIRKFKTGLPELIRQTAAKNIDKAKKMLADIGLVFQVKGAKYNGLNVPSITEAVEAFDTTKVPAIAKAIEEYNKNKK